MIWHKPLDLTSAASPDAIERRISEHAKAHWVLRKRLIGRVKERSFKLTFINPLWTAGLAPVLEGHVEESDAGALVHGHIRPGLNGVVILAAFWIMMLTVAVILIVTNGWIAVAATLIATQLLFTALMVLPYRRRAAFAERLLSEIVTGAS